MSPRRRRLARRAAIVWTACVLAVAMGARVAAADDERMRTLDPLPVTIRYQARHTRVADRVTEICRDEIPRIASELGLTHLDPIEIVVTADARRYDATLADGLPQWGVAFAILEEQRILVDVNRATRAYNSLEEVVPHELSHLFVRQRAGPVRMPVWFLEGLAQWQAREWTVVDSWRLMQSVWSGTAPRLREVTRSYPAPEEQARAAYAVSYAAFTFLFEEGGFDRLSDFMAVVRASGDFERAFREYWLFSLADYDAYFQDDIERRYHSRLLVFQSGPLFGFAALVFVAVIVRHVIRNRRKFRQLEE